MTLQFHLQIGSQPLRVDEVKRSFSVHECDRHYGNAALAAPEDLCQHVRVKQGRLALEEQQHLAHDTTRAREIARQAQDTCDPGTMVRAGAAGRVCRAKQYRYTVYELVQ